MPAPFAVWVLQVCSVPRCASHAEYKALFSDMDEFIEQKLIPKLKAAGFNLRCPTCQPGASLGWMHLELAHAQTCWRSHSWSLIISVGHLGLGRTSTRPEALGFTPIIRQRAYQGRFMEILD